MREGFAVVLVLRNTQDCQDDDDYTARRLLGQAQVVE